MVEFLPITAERLVVVREKTEQDEPLLKLKHVIKVGWPDKKELKYQLKSGTYQSRWYSFQRESSDRPSSA